MKLKVFVISSIAALALAGTASAVTIKPGQCAKVSGVRVCATRVQPTVVVKTVTQNVNVPTVPDGCTAAIADSTSLNTQHIGIETSLISAMRSSLNGDYATSLATLQNVSNVLIPQMQTTLSQFTTDSAACHA